MLEPRDKLDAVTVPAERAADAVGDAVARAVNGPEGAPSDWLSIDWRRAEADVRRMRLRIFTAAQAGDLKRVRNLQKLMLRSRANTLFSVRRVTEINAGRLTPGVDGQRVLTAEGKASLTGWIDEHQPWQARPVKR